MPLNKDLREFLALLNSNGVEYLVVGAFAVAYYGFPRYTGDLDLFVRPASENAARILRALAEFGFGALDVKAADLESPGTIVQLGVQPNRIDLVTEISAVSFDEAWATCTQAELDGVPTRFIGPETLLRNKESTGRAKDSGDAAELRRRMKKK